MNCNAITWIMQSKRASIFQPSFSFYIALSCYRPPLTPPLFSTYYAFILQTLCFYIAKELLLRSKSSEITM